MSEVVYISCVFFVFASLVYIGINNTEVEVDGASPWDFV